MNRPLAGLVVGLVVTLTASACGSNASDTTSSSTARAAGTGAPDAAGTLTIAYAGVTDAVPLYKGIGDGLAAAVTEQGDELLRYDNKLDPTAGLTNARLMAQQKPDVIIDWNGAGNNEALGALFKRAGIPCIAVNFPIPGCSLYNLDQAGTGAQLGRQVATTVAAKGWQASEMTVLLVGATGAGIGPVRNVGGFYSAFAQQFPELDQRTPDDFTLTTTTIGTSGLLVDGGGTVDGAYAATQRALQTIDGSKKLVVDVLADGMAPGVLRALQQSGRLDNTVLASTGADAESLQQLRTNPAWVAEGDLGLSEWPRYLLAMSRALRSGSTLPELTTTPYRVVTKENVDQLFAGDRSISRLPVPAEDQYLLEHGLED